MRTLEADPKPVSAGARLTCSGFFGIERVSGTTAIKGDRLLLY